MLYRTCPFCGANLDPGERCDCQKKEPPTVQKTQQTAQEEITCSLFQYRTPAHAGPRR